MYKNKFVAVCNTVVSLKMRFKFSCEFYFLTLREFFASCFKLYIPFLTKNLVSCFGLVKEIFVFSVYCNRILYLQSIY